MISCKELVKTVSSDQKISWMRRLEIRFHLLMCRHCSSYTQQLHALKLGFKKLFDPQHRAFPAEKMKEHEENIIKKIQKP